MQLDALLRSIDTYAKHLLPVRVVYRSSNEAYERAYTLLRAKRDDVEWYPETTFNESFKSALHSPYSLLMMLVDDDVFYRAMPVIDSVERGRAYAPRLGKNCDWCYMVNKPQNAGEYDFGCTMSVDGHVYPVEDIMPWLQPRTFTDPNDIENQLYDKVFPALDFEEHSCLVGIPNNRVGALCTTNRQGSGSTAYLNDLFLAGVVLNLKVMDFDNVRACHQDIPFIFDWSRV
jgi:hypothetical protein